MFALSYWKPGGEDEGCCPPSLIHFPPGPTHLHSGQRRKGRTYATEGGNPRSRVPGPRKQEIWESDHRPVTFRAARALQGPLHADPGLSATRGRAGSQSARRVGRGAAGGQAQQPGERLGERASKRLGAGEERQQLQSQPRVREGWGGEWEWGSGLSDDLAPSCQGGRHRKRMPRKQN